MVLLSDQIQEFIDWLKEMTEFGDWNERIQIEVHEKLIECMISVPAATPPAPTAEPTIDEQVLRDLETRIFYAETSLKALVDSARLWKSLASTPAAPPARVSKGKDK